MGSIAFGSFVHAIIFPITFMLDKTRIMEDSYNPCIKCLASCLRLVTACFENCVEHLNKGAIAYMAITGDSYCTSASVGFLLSLKHLTDFYLSN